MELTDKVWLGHMIGFANAQVYLSLQNIGARPVRVRSVELELARHGQYLQTITSQTYVENEVQKASVLWLPFTLGPSDEWGHRVTAYEALVAREDRELGRLRSRLKANIDRKVDEWRATNPGREPEQLIEADDDVLQPVMELFRRKFIWEPGEYTLKVRVIAAHVSQNLEQSYRFTLFDTDSEELKGYATDYRYGFGPALETDRHTGIICQLHVLHDAK